jgi:large subunit ribosomal protein L30e
MAKKKVSEIALEIRRLLAAKKLVIGNERTLKMLQAGKLSSIMLSANCADSIAETLNKYSALAGVEIKKIGLPSDELGVTCKKPFSISVLGVLKGK